MINTIISNYEFEDKGWEVEFVSIGSNRLQNWNDVELKKWIDSKPKTDIVLFMDWGRFDSPLLDKNLVGFKVQESGDDKTLRETFLNQKDFTSHYHLIQINN